LTLKAANDAKIQTNGASSISHGRMRSHDRRFCRNRARASGRTRFSSSTERASRVWGAGAYATIFADAERQSIESEHGATIKRNACLAGNAGYRSGLALSGLQASSDSPPAIFTALCRGCEHPGCGGRDVGFCFLAFPIAQLHNSLGGGKSPQGGVDTAGALLPTVTGPLP
jgi:hypothetical protein